MSNTKSSPPWAHEVTSGISMSKPWLNSLKLNIHIYIYIHINTHTHIYIYIFVSQNIQSIYDYQLLYCVYIYIIVCFYTWFFTWISWVFISVPLSIAMSKDQWGNPHHQPAESQAPPHAHLWCNPHRRRRPADWWWSTWLDMNLRSLHLLGSWGSCMSRILLKQ